jgi:hypothetical protein
MRYAMHAALILALSSQAVAQPKPLPDREAATKQARKVIEDWFKDRDPLKLFLANKKSRVEVRTDRVQRVTWDVLPPASREGTDRSGWLEQLVNYASSPTRIRFVDLGLGITRWEIESMRLTREAIVVVAKVTGGTPIADKDKLTISEDRTPVQETTHWMRQGGRYYLNLGPDRKVPNLAGEELYDEPWFGGTRTATSLVRRLVGAGADPKATMLERERQREEVTKELSGLDVADAGEVLDVTTRGCLRVQVGASAVNVWLKQEDLEKASQLRKGDWVVFRGKARVDRWGSGEVGYVLELTAESEWKVVPPG